MSKPKHIEVIDKTPSAVAKAVREPKGKNSLISLAAELQLEIVHYLPRTSLPSICRLSESWRRVGREELLRWLLSIPPGGVPKHVIGPGVRLLHRVILHFIETNNADALQHLLDLKAEHPSIRPRTTPLLLAEPASLRARVAKDEEERFCLEGSESFSSYAVKFAFKYNDMSCMQLLIDNRITDYHWLLHCAVNDDSCRGFHNLEWLARPFPGLDSRGGRNSVLNWLLAYPPRHVVHAMLVMWGSLSLHPRLVTLCDRCDWQSRDRSESCKNMLSLVASYGHPASLQTIDELRMMVELLTDDDSGGVIPEACQPLSHALLIARGMASMWPGTPPLVAEYLQSVCTWEEHQSSSCGSRSNVDYIKNPQPPPAPPLILPPQDPVLHQHIDLKTYDEMLEHKNWQALRYVERNRLLLWLVSTEFLADEDAARRMRRFKKVLRELHSDPRFTYHLLHVAGSFRRWCCVEVVLGELRSVWPRYLKGFGSPDKVLFRAILDAVHGEPGSADGRIIRKLLRTGAGTSVDDKDFGVDEVVPDGWPFRGFRFGMESFCLAFVEQQQDRETPACIEMRVAVLDNLSISDQIALDNLVGEPSKALYRACKGRLLQRMANKRERDNRLEGESSCEESSDGFSVSSNLGEGESSCEESSDGISVSSSHSSLQD